MALLLWAKYIKLVKIFHNVLNWKNNKQLTIGGLQNLIWTYSFQRLFSFMKTKWKFNIVLTRKDGYFINVVWWLWPEITHLSVCGVIMSLLYFKLSGSSLFAFTILELLPCLGPIQSIYDHTLTKISFLLWRILSCLRM